MSGGSIRDALGPLRAFGVHRPGSALAALLLGTIALAALFAPVIAPQNPFDLSSFDVLSGELPPSWLSGGDSRFLLGTDSQGRDLFRAIPDGARISLNGGVVGVAVQGGVGIPLGLLAAYFGGGVDSIIPRAADVQLSLSTLML